MLRLFRLRPSILRLGAFGKAQARTEPQIIRFQRVKVRPKLYKPLALATAVITYATAWYIYSALTGSVIDRFLANEMADMSLEERKRLKKKLDQAEPFYLPLPGTWQMVEPQPYKSTDPEWKTFVRMSQDPQLVRGLKAELAEIVVTKVSRNPWASQKFGKNLRVTALWLDMHYPHNPPPTYEQKVLSWEPEGLTITTKPISSLAAHRLSHILWPSAMGLSTWTFAKELFKQNLRATANFFGFGWKPTDSVDGAARGIVAWHPSGSSPGAASGKSQPIAKTQTKAHGDKDQNALASPDTQAANGPRSTSRAPTMSPGSTTSSSTTSPKASGPDAEAASSSNAKYIPGIRQMAEHIGGPQEAMLRTFSRKFQPAWPLPPRGSVFVSGFMKLASPDGTMTLEVLAYWDPAEKKWWPPVDIKLRQAQLRVRQRPPQR